MNFNKRIEMMYNRKDWMVEHIQIGHYKTFNQWLILKYIKRSMLYSGVHHKQLVDVPEDFR